MCTKQQSVVVRGFPSDGELGNDGCGHPGTKATGDEGLKEHWELDVMNSQEHQKPISWNVRNTGSIGTIGNKGNSGPGI